VNADTPDVFPRVATPALAATLIAATAVGCANPTFRRPVAVSVAVASALAPTAVDSHSAPTTPAAYTLGCPDVLAVAFADHPHADYFAAIDLDGRLPLPAFADLDRPHVEGRTVDEARLAVARAAGMDPSRVSVTLADPRTGRVYVHGPERGRQRAVGYVGPERLTDFLDRVGAVRPGCSDVRDVCVVRPNVAAGGKTEVFRADLEAVVQDGDHTTNVVLRPGDQVYVGETRRSSFARLLPVWLSPGYHRLVGLLPAGRRFR
jgi:protein involved in polysaccharide export with SLBB domain